MRLSIAALALLLASVSVLHADDWTDQQRSDLRAAGLKYGITTIRAMAVSMDTALPPPTADISAAQRQALEKVMQGYVKERQSSQGTLMAFKGGAEFLVDSTAVSMAATGVGLVPAAIFKTSAQVASDVFFSGMEADINRNLTVYLKKIEPQLLQVAGGDYETLRQETPAGLKAKLDQQTTVFAEINNMVGNDPLARERAQGMVIEAIRATSKATLDQIQSQDERLTGVEQRVGTLANAVAKFERRTVAVLDRHEKALRSLSDDMNTMREAVTAIDGRLKTQERNAGFVNDFVFDSMPPGTKAAALRGGFLKERFACPPASPNCDGPALKEDLIKRFEAEARIASHVATVKETVTALNNVASIATDLGINIPGLNEAVQYGTAAANAFASFATGNYLGAIASVTGVFRKKSDPEAERFKMLMSYLRQQFEVINAKLDAILENQKKMMEALGKLSEQMRSYYVSLDERLMRMEFELKRVRDIGLTNLWQPWTSCQAVYEHLLRNEAQYRYVAQGDFVRMDDLYAAIGTIGESAKSCAKLGQERTTTITSSDWFGNFLDVRLVRDGMADPLPPLERGEFHTKSQLNAFIESVHAPSYRVLLDLLGRHSLPLDRGLELLVSPGFFVRDIPHRLAQKPAGQGCGLSGYLQDRVQRLICGTGDPSSNAATLITTPMSVDGALRVTQWLLAVSRFADLIDQSTGNIVPRSQLLAYAATTANSISPGRDILEKTQAMLDAAVAGYSVLYGDLTARSIVDALFNPVPDKGEEEARRQGELKKQLLAMLKENPFLAHNVVQIYLHDRYRKIHPLSDAKPSELEYRTAYEGALRSSTEPSFLLRGVFGDDLKFVVDTAKNQIQLNLNGAAAEADAVLIPIAEPQAFVGGRLIYPARMTRLMDARTRVAERLADYRSFSGLNKLEQTAVAWAVARAEHLSPEKASARAQDIKP
ncbi:hypothetical protein WHZ78_01725 [Bradyrhizobium symbiodeficiens]|uniref:hypothetical protein n=1 Tax=Bradyrhizobium symbiodeficiens TaxID=1404367 RepID=UPI0030D0B84E